MHTSPPKKIKINSLHVCFPLVIGVLHVLSSIYGVILTSFILFVVQNTTDVNMHYVVTLVAENVTSRPARSWHFVLCVPCQHELGSQAHLAM